MKQFLDNIQVPLASGVFDAVKPVEGPSLAEVMKQVATTGSANFSYLDEGKTREVSVFTSDGLLKNGVL